MAKQRGQSSSAWICIYAYSYGLWDDMGTLQLQLVTILHAAPHGGTSFVAHILGAAAIMRHCFHYWPNGAPSERRGNWIHISQSNIHPHMACWGVCMCGQVISEMCSGFFRICIICWFCCFTRTWLGLSAALVCPFLCQPKDLCRRTKMTGVYVWDLHELHELLQCPSEMGTPTITPCQQWKPGFVSLYLPRFKRHIKFMRVAFTSLYLCLTGRCFMGATVLGGRAEKTQIIRQPRRRHFVGSPVSYVFF